MTRLECRMRDALEGNEREVLEHYNAEIAAERNRKAQSHNAFVRQCCDQQIERLLAEKQQIEAATIDRARRKDTMKQNAFFDEMYRIGHEWSEKHAAHQKLKEEIIATRGWDSPELEAWYAEEEEMKFPFSSGANKAYRAWRYSQGEEVVMEDFCWTAERHDFIDTLRKAGMKTFVTTNQSTGLMEDIHGYIAEGCTMLGICTITRKKESWGETTEETIQGIRFAL